MFNLKKKKEAQRIQEKYLRDENLGPKADDDQPIVEKILPHREGDKYIPTEGQINDQKSADMNSLDQKIIEKVLNDSKDYRTAKDGLQVPAINEVVAKMEVDRNKSIKDTKKPHWSQTFNEKKQQGDLPKWPKVTQNPDQKHILLQNDPRRFEGSEVKPIVGGITTANIDEVVRRVKTGESAEYDMAITAILKEADNDKRELTSIERKTISDLKVERTRAMMKSL